MNGDSIQSYYSEDHDRLDELFGRFQSLKASDLQNAAGIFKEFRAGLERHIDWEEEILFPTFEDKTGHRSGPTEVMRHEHRQIREILDAIDDKLARGDDDTVHEEKGLLAVLEPHNQKEEGILYPMIDRVTNAEEREMIFAEMKQAS
ncbi:MAG: hemerythrin domain-containing protein [Xanthomonadales bacterium]|nr:hemerythrin domain-containing protein [Xanthomonadales bacterium]